MTSPLVAGLRSPPSGIRSPPLARSEASSSPTRPRFDSEQLKPYMKALLTSTLGTAAWPGARDRARVKGWMKEIGERVKERMLEISPTGFKYIVLTQINENCNQGGRADLVCHWEDSDAVAQEMFSNDSIICICIAFAVRTA